MKIFVVLLLLWSAAASGRAQNFAELEKTVAAEMREKNAVGAAIAVVKGDKIIYAKGFGAANSETHAPVTADTLFQTGSITKTFTAALVLSLAEEGKLKLDEPVGAYVKRLSPRLARVNLSQLLSHTAGIIDEPDEFGTANEDSMATYIRSWRDDYALFEPGETFSYSNSGYALAGLTAQEAVGKSYVDLMSERIFAPLGMHSATFRPTVAMTYPLAVGHRSGTKPGEMPSVVRPLAQDARLYPAGTFYASLNDLTRFATAFLNGGVIDGKQIIAPGVIAKMSAPRAVQRGAADDTQYGYGLFMNTHRGVRQLWHDGSMTGYVAQMKFIPEQKIAVIILGNTNNAVLNKTQEKALELIAALQPIAETKTKAALSMTETEMRDYVGTYDQPNRWKIEILVKNGQLLIRELNQELPLTKIGEHRFSLQFPNAPRAVEIHVQPATGTTAGFVSQYVWAFKKIQN